MSGRRRRMTALLTAGVLLTLPGGAARAQVVATGGDATNDVGDYRVHVFTNVGDHVFNVDEGGQIEYLVIGGGGGGGSALNSNLACGGGGAGGVLEGVVTLDPDQYIITVGARGRSSKDADVGRGNATGGGNSAIGTQVIAFGGGAGQGHTAGGGGGSGGGGRGASGTAGAGGSPGGGESGQGYGGGLGYNGAYQSRTAGGGGGAGGAGTNAISGSVPGPGGVGRSSDITGETVWYAGGGGGGRQSDHTVGTGGAGGAGGGGSGGRGSTDAGDGQPNRGGGGGGAATRGTGTGDIGHGGRGGSGIVIVRYQRDTRLPAIENLPATNITANSAWLNGHLVFPGDAPSSVSVYWGTTEGGDPTSGLWQATNTWAEGTWTEGSHPTFLATGLAANQMYHYRFYATNAFGHYWPLESESLFISSPFFVGFGGNETNDVGGYRIHVFTNVGDHIFDVTHGGKIEYLVVGGGGGGGSALNSNLACGGGGAGGFLEGVVTLASGQHTITVGSGGLSSKDAGVGRGYATGGGDSTIGTQVIAFGGGTGEGHEPPGGSGGSGGGGRGASSGTSAPGGGESGQGYGGGLGSNGLIHVRAAGGGGGAGGAGTNAISGSAPGPGGVGRSSEITGDPVWYAGGGGGGWQNDTDGPGGAGGAGGGGTGGRGAADAGDGQPNRGGGGGGAATRGTGGSDFGHGGRGGSGIVIVRYRQPRGTVMMFR